MAKDTNFSELTLVNVVEDLDKELGRGAYGRVFSVKYCGTVCAAKEIHSILLSGAKGPDYISDTFLRECYQCSVLRHPNLVQFLGVYYRNKSSTLPVMVMEMMGDNLTKFFSNKQASNQKIPVHVKWSILHDVALGLRYLHCQDPPVIHRDLSPNNILLTSHMVAKIGDLGVAKVIRVDRKTVNRYTRAPGTTDFMPPEALINQPKYCTALDVFSYAGIVLFVANEKWPKPADQVASDPKTKELKARSEVERRRHYIDQLSSVGFQALESTVFCCLNNEPGGRPTIVQVCETVENIKDAHTKNTPHANMNFLAMHIEIQKLTAKISEQSAEIETLQANIDELEAAEEKCCTHAGTQIIKQESIEVDTQTVHKRAERLNPDADEETNYANRKAIIGAIRRHMLTAMICTLLLIVAFYYGDAQTHCSNSGTCSVNIPINGVAYCVDPQPMMRPDAPLCPARGGAQLGGVLCPECAPGSYQTEDRDTGIQICRECPKGTYQTEIDQTQCISCPPNRTTEFAGTRSDSRCFLPCEPGYVSVNGLETAPRGSIADCRPCGVGYYQPDSEQRYCIQCPDGENTSSIASTQREQCIRKCDPGCVSRDHGLAPCQKCQKGQYIGFMQSTFCFACPEGQSTLPFENSTCGATSIDDCRTVCLPGSYSTDQTGLAPCEKCDKDFYQTAPDQSDCIPCNHLYGTLGIGTSREEDCLKKCGPGNYSQNGFEPCTLCAQGEYQEDYEQYECIKCPPGTTTGYTGTRDSDHCVDKGQIPSDILPDPFPTDMDPENVPAIPQKVSGSKSPTSSTHDDRNRIFGIAEGVSVAVLVVIGIILIASMIYFRTRGSDPVTVKHRELSEDKAVLWTSGTGNLRVEPTNRMSRISTATDGFANPVYSMEDAISKCETDTIFGDLVHNPLYMDDDMLQHGSDLINPLFQDDDVLLL